MNASEDEAAEVVLVSDAPTRWRAWLELFRLPNVFTAMADIFLGYLLVNETLAPWPTFLLLLLASSLLYTAGMVLNDVFDEVVDRAERPGRPIPSGRIPLTLALHTGGVMLGSGVACGWSVSFLSGQWQSGVVATLLAIAILFYDRVLKSTPVAPLVMGSCRTLNVLLGASAGLPWQTMHYAIALGLGIYIAGVTWFARREARESHRLALIASLFVMAGGMVILATFPTWAESPPENSLAPTFAWDLGLRWPLIWIVLGFLILRRCVMAILEPTPRRVQAAVKQCILSVIVLDAVACFAVHGLPWAVIILILLVPTLTLGRWLYST